MKYNKKHTALTILLPVFWLIVKFLSRKPVLIENYYSNGIYPIISKTLRFLLGWIPFSFGDVLGVFLIVLLLKNMYKLFKNKFRTFIDQLLHFTAILSVLYCCFYFFWGLNYFREPLAKKLGLKHTKYSNEELIRTTRIIIHEVNKSHLKITKNDTTLVNIPYSTQEIYKKAEDGFNKVISTKHLDFQYKYPSVKSSLVSLLQSYNGTSGYINPITNEAQINNMIPKTGMPATTCHEIAHQLGWGPENEANFIGFLASTLNRDMYFQYSGYRMALNYCLREVRKRDKNMYHQLWKTVNKGISKDFTASYNHWRKFDNPIEPYIKKGYNSYLKANNQQKGIKSYNYVVDLLISYYEHLN